jgi:hypothetical protein
MGFALPAGVANSSSVYFYPDAKNQWKLVRDVTDNVLVIIDYSKLAPPINISSWTFTTDVSSNPPLVIAFAQTDTTKTIFSFLVSGGIEGQAYSILITVGYGTGSQRNDTLLVEVPTCECGCAPLVPSTINSLPAANPTVNTALRYFYGPLPPIAPNLMDQWYDVTLNVLYSWATDGNSYFWKQISSTQVLPVETYFPFAEQVASYQSGPQTKFNLTYPPVDATTTMNAIVNGQVFAGCQNPSAFTVNGNVVTWVSPIYGIAPTDTVIFDYHYLANQPPPAPPTPPAPTGSVILYYITGQGQTVFSLSSPDFFGNTYQLTTNNILDVTLNGTRLMLDNGTGTGGFTYSVASNTVTLLYPAGAGGQLIINIFGVIVVPPVAKSSASLYYVATNGQTAFNLSTPDFFNNSYTLQTKDVVHVSVSGSRFMPDNGTSTGGYTIAGNVVTLVHPAAPGAQISIDVLEAQ